MSEKPHTPEKATFKQNHNSFLAKARFELGSLNIGFLSGALGAEILTLAGITNPIVLLLGWAAGIITGRHFARKAT